MILRCSGEPIIAGRLRPREDERATIAGFFG